MSRPIVQHPQRRRGANAHLATAWGTLSEPASRTLAARTVRSARQALPEDLDIGVFNAARAACEATRRVTAGSES
jgi:hypothetical protein